MNVCRILFTDQTRKNTECQQKAITETNKQINKQTELSVLSQRRFLKVQSISCAGLGDGTCQEDRHNVEILSVKMLCFLLVSFECFMLAALKL